MPWYSSFCKAISRKKSIEANAVIATELQRCLSTLDLTFIGIGSTLGAGIYVLTGEVAKNVAGPAIVLSFLLAAIASILSGLCYAEFGARVPKAGSAYLYCYITIGELLGFYVGWNLILEYVIGAASIIRSLSSYIDSMAHGAIQNGTIEVIGKFPENVYFSSYFDLFSILIVSIITVLLSLGVKNSARFNNFCVAINMATIVLVIAVGLYYGRLENWSNFAPYGAKGVFAGAATCFFAFIGFDVIATTSEEAQNPAKAIPFSMTGTIVFCFLAYFGVSGALTLMVPYQQLDKQAAVVMAFHQRGLKFMATIIGIGACLGLIGCSIISCMPLPRLLYALSQDGLLPPLFSRVNGKTNVPVISTIIAGIFIGLMAALLDIDALVEMLSIGTLLAYTIVDICVLILRYKDYGDTGCSNNDVSTKSAPSNKNRNLYLVILACLILLFVINFILSGHIHKLKTNLLLAVIFTVAVIGFLLTCVYLARRKSNSVNLSFQVPLLPWIPLLALFFNTYLMLSLSRVTWYRFLVWMFIGTFVYFGYSMHHSVECDKSEQQESQPLIERESRLVDDEESDEELFSHQQQQQQQQGRVSLKQD